MRNKPRLDVLRIGTGSNDAQTNRAIVLQLKVNQSRHDRVTHRLTVQGLPAFDNAQRHDAHASRVQQALGGQRDFERARHPHGFHQFAP